MFKQQAQFRLHRPARITMLLRCTLLVTAGLATAPVLAQSTALAAQWDVVDRYCVGCHNLDDYAGGVAFDIADRNNLPADAATWEHAVRKLRTGLMPPAGEPRPERAVLDALAQALSTALDASAVTSPGSKMLTRLNRAEYVNAIRDLLAFDASKIVAALPEDSAAGGFDNLAETLSISPTLLEAYVTTAMEISRQAVGDMSIGATDIHYTRNGNSAQLYHLDGEPPGTRGGMQITHNFPLDAEYVLRINADIQDSGWKNDEGRMWWCEGPGVAVSFNNTGVDVDDYRNFRVRVPAGPQQIAVALLDEKKCAGAVELYLGEALASVGGSVQEIEIQGPFNATGAGSTPSRRRIFVCEPLAPAEEEACARDIFGNLATFAYRRPVAPDAPEIDYLLSLYSLARTEAGGNFELGIQYGLSRLLVSPEFIYRFEETPADAAPGSIHAITDLELASRLSFFLWSSLPDEALLLAAVKGELQDPQLLQAQVTRMLQDERAQALVDNFASQWLNLRELDEAAPQDAAFDDELRHALRAETELFFTSVLRDNLNVLTLLDADYTYLNERLAKHYGIDGVRGSYMRRVSLPADSPRRGLLGKGSILTATSNPNRTSPVIRGVWIVENLLGAEVPAPPPGVETDLSPKADASGVLHNQTLRERLESHRENPVCAGCHGIMDPIGLALENFDMVGRWREMDGGITINPQTVMTDGTRITSPADLRKALLARAPAFLTTFTEHLLTYALGRQLDYHDGPAVRKILREAATKNYSFAAIVQAIVTSDPFGKRLVPEPTDVLAAAPRTAAEAEAL